MARRRLAALPLSVFVAGVFTLSQAPAEGCSKRSLACPTYDSCSDASPCPALRCVCDDAPETFAPTCGNDHTCFTSLDCPELCGLGGSKCSQPPTQCSQFNPTQCICGASTEMRFAAAWDCSKGMASTVSQSDCNRACTGLVTMGGAGSGGSGSSVGTATSTLAATTATTGTSGTTGSGG